MQQKKRRILNEWTKILIHSKEKILCDDEKHCSIQFNILKYFFKKKKKHLATENLLKINFGSEKIKKKYYYF